MLVKNLWRVQGFPSVAILKARELILCTFKRGQEGKIFPKKGKNQKFTKTFGMHHLSFMVDTIKISVIHYQVLPIDISYIKINVPKYCLVTF